MGSQPVEYVWNFMDTKRITLTLTIDETNWILAGLAKLPFEVASPLIQNIQTQATPQLQETEQPPEEGEQVTAE